MYWRLYSILSLPIMSRAVLMHEIAKSKSRQIVLLTSRSDSDQHLPDCNAAQ